MLCAKCKTENPDGLKFCNECGTPFKTPCASCGFENAPAAKFCGHCGAAFGAPAASAKKSDQTQIRLTDAPTPENLDGERKTVTVLFADIKGSMELIEDLDPEEASAIVDPALKLMMEAVQHYGGYVAQSTGDGIFALFGAPIAYEDHSRRALLAALRMQQELKRYSARTRAEGRLPIQVRVGVNTGEVVVRTITTGEAKREYVPIGHSISLAARMQALAPIGSIATTEQVRKLCEGYFAFAGLGPTKVKGVSEPVNVYEVTGLGPLRTRLQRAAARGYTKFIGRDREMEALRHAADQARAGHGEIVAAVAEPGVGKSRLFYEFKATSQSGWMSLEGVSFSHDKASAYLPVVDLLSRYFAIQAEDDGRKRREKVAGRIAILDRALEDTLPYLYGLLGLIEGDDPLAGMDVQIRHQRTLEALKRILLRESLNQPLMIIFEDLHWIDDKTQAFLNLLADSIGTAKLLLLVNYRPEYSHQWTNKTYYTQLRLDPLSNESANKMFDALLGLAAPTTDDALAALKRLFAEKSEGNPLFMEELVQALIEEGALVRNGTVRLTRSLDTLKIPSTVQAILASRIDRLPAVDKELLQTLAVIGREFQVEVARKTVQLPSDRLDSSLSRLQAGEFIYEQPTAGDVEYHFKHALTHESAYNSVLIERRKALHERVAQAIEELNANTLDDYLADLAHHYERSGNRMKAVDYLTRAGTQIAQRSASPEAMQHFERALAILKEMPAGRSRDSSELRLQMAIAGTAFYYQGENSADVGKALSRAVELAVSPEDMPQKAVALTALGHHHVACAKLRRASEISQDVYELIRGRRSPGLDLWGATRSSSPADANQLIGRVALEMGEFRKAEQFFRAAAEVASRESVGARGLALVCRGTARWYLGFPDQALALAKEAVVLGEDAVNRYQYPITLWYAGHIHMICGELTPAEDLLLKSINLCTERGYPAVRSVSTLLMRLVSASHGRSEPGQEQISSASELLAARSATFKLDLRADFWECYLALGYDLAERPDEAFATLIRVFERMKQSGAEAELASMHVLKGRLFEGKSNSAEAENSFRTSIEIARRQGAKSLELRATTSLARLLDKQGRRDKARTMLADIYNWFTEGFDTADLKDAKALLEELSN